MRLKGQNQRFRISRGIIFVIGLCLLAHNVGFVQGAGGVRCVDLRCEYLNSPLGIDVIQPRLGWKIEAADTYKRGLHQQAYRILVAGSVDTLARNQGDLWDSHEVKSDQSIHVVYQGVALKSGMQCFWKVQVWDQDGHLSPWSKPSRWTMGLLEPSDWQAQWIGTDQQFVKLKGLIPTEKYLADPWLRKVITVEEKPTRATMYVASVGFHELYINGTKVTDTVLMPHVSDHSKRARYVTYEIDKYLKPGKNVIGLWLGTSWSIYPIYKTQDKPQTPIVLAQADIEYADKKTQRVITDATWKTHPSPNVLLGEWKFGNYGGEFYDAAREMANWCQTDLDDSNWKAATVYHPHMMMSALMLEPNRRQKKISPVAVQELPQGDYRVDMGVNFAGMVEIDLRGEPGDVIDMKSSEDPNKMITHKLRSAYRIGPKGKGTFRHHFNYSSGRWILIKGLKYPPALEDIRGYQVRTDYQRAGWVECSNQLLNDIYNVTLWTYENLTLGGYVVDCPQRERMGYGGDAHATTQTAMNNYRVGAFYTKWSQDWRDVQAWDNTKAPGEQITNQNVKGNGNLPYTAPTYWGGGGPAWSGYCVTLPWYIYRHYGDKRILEVNFDTIQHWLAFLETKSKNDMLVRWGGKWDFLGDWVWPGAEGVNGDTRETLFFNNCYWIYNLQTAADIADVLGKQDIAAKYRRRAQAISQVVHKEFFDHSQNGYVNNMQAYLAVALLIGLPPENVHTKVWHRFEDEILIHRKGHFWGGITGGYFIVKNLLEFDRPDLMYVMATKTDYPGWGDMLRRGATTVWEDWEGKLSRLHSSYLHVGAWFMEGLAGIKPDPKRPGYKHIIIKPGLMKDRDLDWVKARFESPYGLIRSEWALQYKNVIIKVAVPPNTTATLYIPTPNPQSIREDRKPFNKAVGVRHLRDEKGCTVMELQPGEYHFVADL